MQQHEPVLSKQKRNSQVPNSLFLCCYGVLTCVCLAGHNTKAAQATDGQHLSKVDRENEIAPPPKVDLSVGRAIAKARSEKTPPWKQSDLAQKINEKPSVINGNTVSGNRG